MLTRNPLSRRDQRGTTTVEVSLVLLAFLVFSFGIFDAGRLIMTYNSVYHGARAAARYATVHGALSNDPCSLSDIRQIVLDQTPGLDPTKVVVTASWNPDNERGSFVNVGVSYPFQLVGPLLPSGITISSASRTVISY